MFEFIYYCFKIIYVIFCDLQKFTKLLHQDLMHLITELPHQVSINTTCRDIPQSRRHSKKKYVRNLKLFVF